MAAGRARVSTWAMKSADLPLRIVPSGVRPGVALLGWIALCAVAGGLGGFGLGQRAGVLRAAGAAALGTARPGVRAGLDTLIYSDGGGRLAGLAGAQLGEGA